MSGAIREVKLGEKGYPESLAGIKEPPKRLYYRGDLSLTSQMSVAVVGTRKATRYGMWAAHQLGRMLAEHGVTVTSGMAAGIDTYSHQGTLSRNGKTIAVLGCGVDVCFPSANRKLMEEIAEKGLVISEYPPGMHATAYSFPLRNRIISGLSAATVVVEAGSRSGALITAERAIEQGKEVYALPGNIDSLKSLGTNKLIKDGALALAVLEDLLDDLQIPRRAAADRIAGLGADEKKLAQLVANGGEVTADDLCRKTGKSPAEINGIVSVLEIKGIVYTFMGKIFIAK